MATVSTATALSNAEKPKRSFDSAFKLKVIDYTSTHSISDTAHHFGIDRKRVREWKKQREELQALPPKKKWLEGGGRKAALPCVEEEVVLWIDEMRAEHQQVTRAHIQQKALSIARSWGETDFTASRGL